MSTQAARLAFQSALKGATEDAKKIIEPGDRVSRKMCGGIRSTFTFTHWDGDWMCGRSVSDCSAASVYAINGKPAEFGCAGLIEVARAELVEALNAERALRMPRYLLRTNTAVDLSAAPYSIHKITSGDEIDGWDIDTELAGTVVPKTHARGYVLDFGKWVFSIASLSEAASAMSTIGRRLEFSPGLIAATSKE